MYSCKKWIAHFTNSLLVKLRVVSVLPKYMCIYFWNYLEKTAWWVISSCVSYLFVLLGSSDHKQARTFFHYPAIFDVYEAWPYHVHRTILSKAVRLFQRIVNISASSPVSPKLFRQKNYSCTLKLCWCIDDHNSEIKVLNTALGSNIYWATRY